MPMLAHLFMYVNIKSSEGLAVVHKLSNLSVLNSDKMVEIMQLTVF